MAFVRRLAWSFGAASLFLAPVGCGSSEPEVVAVERVPLTGKMVVVKRAKPKQYVATTDGKMRAHGEFKATTGSVKAEDTVDNELYCLVHSGKDDFWIKADDLVGFEESKKYFEEMLAESPRSYDAYTIRAQVAMETGHPERAVADLTEAVKVKSNATAPFFLRAASYEMLGDHAKAQLDYEKALKLEPSNMQAFLGKARCLAELGHSERALVDLDAALKFNPKSVACYVQRAQIWAGRGEHPAAQLDFDRAIEADPHSVDVFVARGQYWLTRKMFDKALADFLTALKGDGERIAALSHAATLLAAGPNVKLRDAKKAGDLAAKAVELTGRKDPAALDALAVTQAAAGQFDEAIKNQKAALEDPVYVKHHGELAKKKLALYGSKLPYTVE
jgi:tetratricopeptide (TPR) repeat protein